MTLEHFDSILAFVLIITGVSLIITTLTQMVSALLGLRGTNLRWGIKTLLANIDPNLKEYAEEISNTVLQHSLASDSAFSKFKDSFSRWRLASAIRQDELVGILKLLAHPPAGPTAGTLSAPSAAALQKSFEALDPKAADDVAKVAEAVKKMFPNDFARAQSLLTPALDSAASLPVKIDQWFDSVMDRSAQRFALQTRIWTVVFAVIVAFGLQLDAFHLFTRLGSDAQVRAQVLATADVLNKQGAALTAKSTNSSPTDALQADAAQLNSLLTNNLMLQIVPQPYPNPIYQDWSPANRAFWGILTSAALLSLGAPFWFNALKELSNLQPVVANKQQAESAAENVS
jgi:hypothetical protein